MNIKDKAKELCNESGCHHKCKNTTDCVVEDEAREYLPFVLTNEEKVSEKEKQIEEMANILKEYTKKNGISASVVILEDYAKELVEKGICSVVRCKNCKHWANTSFDPITEYHWGECQKPLGDYRYLETAENDYCSYGEMKGGEE